MSRRNEDGSAIVEFSVVLSLLLLLILGAISFGVILARGQVLQQASGEATRTVSLALAANAGLDRNAVAQESIRRSLADATACSPGSAVSCPVSAPAPCSATEPAALCVTVTVKHNRNVDSIVGRLPLIDRLLPAELEASSSARVG